MTSAETPKRMIALLMNPVFGSVAVLVGVAEADAVTVAEGVEPDVTVGF